MLKKYFVASIIVLAIITVGIAFISPLMNPEEDAGEPFNVDNNMQIARLSTGDSEALESIRKSFAKRNPGYDLEYFSNKLELEKSDQQRVVFVQEGSGTATLSDGNSSKFSIGDILLINQGISLSCDSAMSMLVFTSPDVPSDSIPKFIRPDWDMNITDVPGGCATEEGAYRRILLTWMGKVGPYLYHSINAHRVRIMDSFTHYHPLDGGFDEFYLVQMAMPDAAIITSPYVPMIEDNEGLTKDQASQLLETTSLQIGDLVYLPRGVAHRGVKGVLAQVITVPGFIPGSEIGLDHHLRDINRRLGLKGEKCPSF